MDEQHALQHGGNDRHAMQHCHSQSLRPAPLFMQADATEGADMKEEVNETQLVAAAEGEVNETQLVAAASEMVPTMSSYA